MMVCLLLIGNEPDKRKTLRKHRGPQCAVSSSVESALATAFRLNEINLQLDVGVKFDQFYMEVRNNRGLKE
jgi:hypothetical protein